jgi:hypothetical protein
MLQVSLCSAAVITMCDADTSQAHFVWLEHDGDRAAVTRGVLPSAPAHSGRGGVSMS